MSLLEKIKFEKIKAASQELINKGRQKLIASLTNKPGSVESASDLLQQIEYLHKNQALDIHIAKMLKGVLSISNLRARDLMIPRAHIDYFEAEQSLREVLDEVLEYGRSRYPILDDNNEDQETIGLLFTKDLLRVLIDQQVDELTLPQISKPIKIIPETKHVTTLLQEFQSSHTHLALVVNEFGEISGLITIEDILEEIVGDISDEFDKEDQFIQQVSKTSFDVLAKTPIYLFNEAFGVELSENEFDTIGGYVFGLLGHMPIRNESVELLEGKLNARITQVNDRQILKLRIRALQDFSVKLDKELSELNNQSEAVASVAQHLEDKATSLQDQLANQEGAQEQEPQVNQQAYAHAQEKVEQASQKAEQAKEKAKIVEQMAQDGISAQEPSQAQALEVAEQAVKQAQEAVSQAEKATQEVQQPQEATETSLAQATPNLETKDQASKE
ncbi:transporter associated domain-containing protein [Psittacicella gerlachiana]|uniref:Magnesium and cobalt efflux protein CorC n=1 Tax=Psittacicella gerlachiana TaxID=2028574 RepID=A0A3A1YMN9_9GAMM|nr:transporter associated domain-containing protein [Psittacicella gerlachiana]RIY38528.1 hypothetical protein CKF59_00655 [Psittacicella gerlachiana]